MSEFMKFSEIFRKIFENNVVGMYPYGNFVIHALKRDEKQLDV